MHKIDYWPVNSFYQRGRLLCKECHDLVAQKILLNSSFATNESIPEIGPAVNFKDKTELSKVDGCTSAPHPNVLLLLLNQGPSLAPSMLHIKHAKNIYN